MNRKPSQPNNTATSAAARQAAMPHIRALTDWLGSVAPLAGAEPWDRVGLLSCPKPDAKVKSIVVALDLTPQVYDLCAHKRADLLVCYHPPIFKPLDKLVSAGQHPHDLALALFRDGVAIYSPHTAFDVAEGGTNDALAAAAGLQVSGSLMPGKAAQSLFKLITFVPSENLESVAQAVFNAGAGHIGKNSRYTQCSFRTPGTGTFLGGDESNPAIGRRGHLEHVAEVRFETVVGQKHLLAAIDALRRAHPYEEPAFDVLPLANPQDTPGLGRIAHLPKPLRPGDFARTVKRRLKLSHVQLADASGGLIRNCALVAGSAGRLALDAHKTCTFDLLMTGELKHHDLLAYRAAGINVLLLGHANSEIPGLIALASQLRQAWPAVGVEFCHPAPLTCTV